VESWPQSASMFPPQLGRRQLSLSPSEPRGGALRWPWWDWAPEAPVLTPTSCAALPLPVSASTSVKWGCNIQLPEHLIVALAITTCPFSILQFASVISCPSSQYPAGGMGGILITPILQTGKLRPWEFPRQLSFLEHPDDKPATAITVTTPHCR